MLVSIPHLYASNSAAALRRRASQGVKHSVFDTPVYHTRTRQSDCVKKDLTQSDCLLEKLAGFGGAEPAL